MKLPNLNETEAQVYLAFMLNQFRRTDGFWFICVEGQYGYEAAVQLNEEVWSRMGRLMTREIKERFSLGSKGLERFARLLELYPWNIITGYRVDLKPDELFVSVPHCPSQEARIKADLGEYNCKDMHRREFEGMIEELGEKIELDCLFAPPDPHPPGLFCRWRFTVSESQGVDPGRE